jgi:hypothetical protein
MKTIVLTITLFYSVSTIGQNSLGSLLKFDGYYETKCYIEKGDDEGSQDYLRFYPTGKVIAVGTDCEGNVLELKEWFNIGAKQVGTADYKITGRRLFFSTKSMEGTVTYKGRIKKGGSINLKWKSQINGTKGHAKYKFIPIAGLT